MNEDITQIKTMMVTIANIKNRHSESMIIPELCDDVTKDLKELAEMMIELNK